MPLLSMQIIQSFGHRHRPETPFRRETEELLNVPETGCYGLHQGVQKKAIIDRKTVLVVTSGPRPGMNYTYSFGLPAFLDDGTPNSIYATEDFVGNEVATITWDWMCPDADTYSKAECNLTDVLNERRSGAHSSQGSR